MLVINAKKKYIEQLKIKNYSPHTRRRVSGILGWFLDYLTQSLNLKGGRKKFQDSGDKARSAVTWRIRNAIKTIQTSNPELGKHLSASIITGNLCSYSPEIIIDWVLEK